MKKLNRIGIALDLSNQDDQILSFVSYISRAMAPELLVGMHVVPVWEIGDFLKIDIKHPLQPVAPALGRIHESLEKEVSSHEWHPNTRKKISVTEGRPHRQIENLIKEEEIELLAVGQKFVSSGSGITSKRLVRHVPSDLLFVPRLDHIQVEKILVAIDFSVHSSRALKKGLELRNALGIKSPVYALYDINLLPFFLYGKFGDDDTVHDDIVAAAQIRYQDFLEKYEFDQAEIDFVIRTGQGKNTSADILEYADEIDADLIMLGAVGHRALENYFLGSVTESLLVQNTKYPIWVIRK